MNSSLVEQLGNGVQLYQVRTGLNVGKKMARTGVVVEGTREAIQAELSSTLTLLDGDRGRAVRARTEELSEIQRSSASGGLARKELLSFSQFMSR